MMTPAQFFRAALVYEGDDCLLWPYGTGAGRPGIKYPQMSVGGVRCSVHHKVCEHAHGLRPSMKHGALHSCGVSLCVAKRHLYWGTQKDNVADAKRHGTFVAVVDTGKRARGIDHQNTKLTIEQVREIRTLKLSQRKIAARYGVSRGAIMSIQYGRSWGWLQ
jgi:hypothetical protein